MKKIISFLFVVASLCATSCSDKGGDTPPTPTPTPPTPVKPSYTEPTACDNIVVAHRGGSTEKGINLAPDNSIAALKYTMELGCYASECDIYWTKDNKVIVAHADSKCQVNGFHPWEATVAEIRAAGKLKNGEQIPLLEEYLDVVMDKSGEMTEAGCKCCTRLWLDIKNITSPSTLPEYPINAAKRACEIVRARKAEKFVEFICTGNATVMKQAFADATTFGIPIGWMANQSPTTYLENGYMWCNLSTTYMNDGIHGGSRNIDDFVNKGIEFSVYTVDKTDEIDYYVENSSKLKAITTNYPKKMLRAFGIER